METIQWIGLAILLLGVGGVFVAANWPHPMTRDELILSQAERDDRCAGCGEQLPFDWALGDHPAAGGGCMSELFETAQREMGEW